MAITTQQFEQLSEIGISLWQSRAADNIDTKAQKNNYIAQSQQSLTNLIEQTLFTDILRCLNLTLGEVKAQDDHLDVGLFNWYFVDKNHDNELNDKSMQKAQTINCINNKLISPSIDIIAQSTQLKKQLWHTIANNLM